MPGHFGSSALTTHIPAARTLPNACCNYPCQTLQDSVARYTGPFGRGGAAMKDWNMPAPHFARFRIEFLPGKGHAVFDPDGKQTHLFLSASQAHRVCEELQAAWNAVRKIGPRA